MRHNRIQGSNARKFGYGGLLLTLLLAAAIPAISADDKPVDPFYLKLAKEGTLILVRPAQTISVPADPVLRPDKPAEGRRP